MPAPVEMKLVHYFSLILLLVASPTLLGSVPVSVDTDGDGIEDSQDADDVVDSQDPWPLDRRYSKDSDSDGLPNKWETRNQLDPNNATDADSETDENGGINQDEFKIAK